MSSFDDLYATRRIKLGSGGYGSVYKCHDRTTRRLYAVKKFSDDKVTRKSYSFTEEMYIPDEIALWRNLRHINVIRYVRHFFEQGTWIVVMEYDHRYIDLFKHTSLNGALSVTDAREVLIQLLDTCIYLIPQGIDHRDIK